MSVNTASIPHLVATKDYSQLASVCEILEQEQDLFLVTGAQSVPDLRIPTCLLASYIILNDLGAARYLVQRTTNPHRSKEFMALALVSVHLWKKDLEAVLIALDNLDIISTTATTTGTDMDRNSDGSTGNSQEHATQDDWMYRLLALVKDTVRTRSLGLIALAYSSISIPHFSTLMGVTADQVESVVASLGWRIQEGFIFPSPPKTQSTSKKHAASRPGLDRISTLAEYSIQLGL
ncbi:COP9 signalosome complex subunit 8 [Batrachochytrium dendrobatidis]|nr:COP9 signalosome complex subunit 8 [Batrachochytrium dendrobatidis]KAK5667063.1 COP9 signalosome complex subunit 8 [Batrachochytrium dendrobatidis]